MTEFRLRCSGGHSARRPRPVRALASLARTAQSKCIQLAQGHELKGRNHSSVREQRPLPCVMAHTFWHSQIPPIRPCRKVWVRSHREWHGGL